MQKASRSRSEPYLRYVRSYTSCVCWDQAAGLGLVPLSFDEIEGGERTVAHHVRMGSTGGVGLKPSDYRTVPLTDPEHRELHQTGERAWWAARGIDPRRVMISLLTLYVGGNQIWFDALAIADDEGVGMILQELERLAAVQDGCC